MVSFALSLLCMILTNGESDKFYVSSSGSLNQHCTASKPCGSLAIALWSIEYGNLEHKDGITIYVSGHYGAPFNANIDCHSSIHGNIIIIFDRESVRSMQDWAPFINLCHTLNNEYILYQLYGEGSSLQFHHLIYHDTSASVYDSSDSMASLHCYQCIFANLSISNHFLSLYDTSAAFIHCVFADITVTATHQAQSVAFMDVSVYSDDSILIIDNCTIHNVRTLTHNAYFIAIEPHITHSVTINLTNVLFTGRTTYDPFTSTRFIYGSTDSKFVNSNNQISLVSCSFIGSVHIVYINEGIFYINMEDIHIATPQYISYPNEDILHLNTLHIGQDSVLTMRNVYYKTLLLCDTYCEMPIGLLYNAGECHLSNITMDSNYLDLYPYSSDHNLTVPYIEPIDMDLSTMHAICGIYNDNEGTIMMDNIFFSNGANYHFLYNLRGTVVVDHLYAIRTLHLFVNYGLLWISNSDMMYCNGVAFELYHGSFSMDNSVLRHVSYLIHSMYTTNAIRLDTVHISRVTHPIHIASRDVSITNCWFELLSPLGMLQFATIGAMESGATASKWQNMEKRMLIIDRNSFIYDPWNTALEDTSLDGYIQIMNPYSLQLTRNQFIFRKGAASSHIPWIYIATTMKDNCIASNTFNGNALYVQNGDIVSCKYPAIAPMNDECLISLGTPYREYTTPDVFINNNRTRSVITLNTSSNIILEWIQFIDFEAIPIQMRGTNHTIALFDIDLISDHTTASSLQVPMECDTKCYEIVDANPQQIRQLQMVCDTRNGNTAAYADIGELAQRDGVMQSVSSWSPYRIHLVSNGFWPGLYPGGTLHINYTIVDMYGNIVADDAAYVLNDLQIQLVCGPLSIDTVLFINGATHACDLCADGLDITHITMDDVGSAFEISTHVLNDVLLVNNLNVSIVYCPQELMVSNQSRCMDPSLNRYVANHVIELEMWIVVVSVSICLTIVLIVYFMCKNQKQQNLKSKEKNLSQYIENPLVVLIGIGIYENYLNGTAKDSQFIDGYFPNLGIDVDLENLSRLFRYLNYKIIGHETKLQWTEDEIMKFIEESAKEACETKYDGLIVILSSHAIPGHIVTTNMRTVSFESIHRAYGCMSYPELRDKPRIFIYDCCIYTSSQQPQPQPLPLPPPANGKTRDHEEIKDDQWIEIRTESGTIQSKMNRMDGSYLLHEFGKRIVANMERYASASNREEVQCLGQILDEINHFREHTGKGPIKMAFCDDRMRYLKLIKGRELAMAQDVNMNGNPNGLDYESMRKYDSLCVEEAETGPPPKISHIAIERVYRSHLHVTCPSIIQSDKASTMSATRRDKFVRRKNSGKNTQKTSMTRRSKYRIIEMEDIEEDSNENQASMDAIEERKKMTIHHTSDVEDEDEEEEDDDDGINEGLKELIISQNIIEVTTTDSSDTETDTGSYKLAAYTPIQLPVSASSTQL